MALVNPNDSPAALADAAEIFALASQAGSYSLEDLTTALRQLGTDPDASDPEFLGEIDRAALLVADAAVELSRRATVLESCYPFSFDGSVLSANEWKDRVAYVFTLLLTASNLGGKPKGRIHFEEIVAEALAQYLGGVSIRFGWPRNSGNSVPVSPDEAITFLADQLVERRSYGFPARKKDKDMGLDVVAWKPFPDGRRGKPVIYGQCATGADWRAKIGDLNLKRWRNYIGLNVDPSPLFAVPWVMDDESWELVHAHGYVIFDRLRVAVCSLGDWEGKYVILNWCTERELISEVVEIGAPAGAPCQGKAYPSSGKTQPRMGK